MIGRKTVRDYWPRQWAATDTSAEPTAVTERDDGTVEVAVHLIARDSAGNPVNEADGLHVRDRAKRPKFPHRNGCTP